MPNTPSDDVKQAFLLGQLHQPSVEKGLIRFYNYLGVTPNTPSEDVEQASLKIRNAHSADEKVLEVLHQAYAWLARRMSPRSTHHCSVCSEYFEGSFDSSDTAYQQTQLQVTLFDDMAVCDGCFKEWVQRMAPRSTPQCSICSKTSDTAHQERLPQQPSMW